MSIGNQSQRAMSPLAAALAATLTGATPQADTTKPERKKSETWMNVGVNIRGGAEDGSDLFVTLPGGIALDNATPVEVSGSSSKMIELKQTKNALLELVQAEAAKLAPGEAIILPIQFRVEIRRKAAPAQTAGPGENSLVGKLFGTLAPQNSGE